MERIIEPELMMDDEQCRVYAYADFGQPHSRFVELFQETCGSLPAGSRVLDLGCGPGDVTIRFARAFPGCTIHGLDGSPAMLRYGRELLDAAPDVSGRIALFLGTLPALPLPQARYDAIISNSLLHHLHDPAVLWEALPRCAASGAPVYVMDLMRPPTIEEAERLCATYSADEPELLQKDYYNSLLAAFEPDEIRSQLESAGLWHFTVKPVSDRHLLVSGRMP